MKKFLTLLLLPLLSGCVTYYYPETAIEDGVYYAEDDPAYVNNAYVNYTYGYAGAAYYPWRSMDYFYLGYRPYYGYDIGYGGYIGSGISIGISYGYSPWYYPSYSYYSPWYYPHDHRRGHHYRGWAGRDRCRSHDACGRSRNGRHEGGHDRYAGIDRDYRRNRGDDRRGGHEGRDDEPTGRRSSNRTGNRRESPVRRYVSTAPSGYSGDRGMVIRNKEQRKIGKSRTDPVKAKRSRVTSPAVSPARSAQPKYSVRRGAGEVRYRSSPKKSRSRTGPVDSRSPSKGIVVASVPVQKNYRSRQSDGEIHYRSGAKKGKSRANPVGSTSRYRAVPSATITSRTVNMPSKGSGYGRPPQGNPPRQASGKSRSNPGARQPSRSKSKVRVSNSGRSHAGSSGSDQKSSGRSGSFRARNRD